MSSNTVDHALQVGRVQRPSIFGASVIMAFTAPLETPDNCFNMLDGSGQSADSAAGRWVICDGRSGEVGIGEKVGGGGSRVWNEVKGWLTVGSPTSAPAF